MKERFKGLSISGVKSGERESKDKNRNNWWSKNLEKLKKEHTNVHKIQDRIYIRFKSIMTVKIETENKGSLKFPSLMI